MDELTIRSKEYTEETYNTYHTFTARLEALAGQHFEAQRQAAWEAEQAEQQAQQTEAQHAFTQEQYMQTVRVVLKGDKVEFYDLTQDPEKFPGGQFVSRYYRDTIMGIDGRGLDLMGHAPGWKLTARTVANVQAWIRTLEHDANMVERLIANHWSVFRSIPGHALKPTLQAMNLGADIDEVERRIIAKLWTAKRDRQAIA